MRELVMKTSAALIDALQKELDSTLRVRDLVKAFDVEGLLSWSLERERRAPLIRSLELQLNQAMEALRSEGADGDEDLVTAPLSEIRMLATRIRQEDSVNRRMIARSMDMLNAFKRILQPEAKAYDRRGAWADGSSSAQVIP